VLPATVEFALTAVHDPYGCAITTDPATGRPTVSVYRRPLPGANLSFVSAVMWDGRETVQPLTDEQTYRQNLIANLKNQATDAVMGHAQGTQPPTDQQLNGVVNTEINLFTAQLATTRQACCRAPA
jgi:hypothetical protein